MAGDDVKTTPARDGQPPAAPSGADTADETADGAGRLHRLRSEALLALEICGLAALAFTRPILDSFGRAPETFLARGAAPRDVILFALLVATVPTLVVAGVSAATGLLGARTRCRAHLAAVGLLGGVAVWRLGSDAAPWRPAVLVLAGAVGAAILVVVRSKLPSAASYLRLLGAASVVFVAQFLVLSPTASLATGGGSGGTDSEAARAVAAATGDDPPPIVVVVVDAVATSSLLDGTGQIDAELFPELASLADGATWYRNHTTTSSFTYEAVPAMLTGQLPKGVVPDVSEYPDNLFTLFAESHRIESVEQITRLCPAATCRTDDRAALPGLLGDAVGWWRGALDTGTEGAQILPGVLEPDRGDEFAQWIDRQDFSAGSPPGLWFYHLVMPHEPWDILDDGTRYDGLAEEPHGLWMHAYWGETGADVAEQRHLLQTQAVDRMLGDLFAELRAAGTYDESLIVVAGDHGQSFVDDQPLRGVSEEQYEQVAWTPLIVKAPHQDTGVVDDTNLWNVDVLPTIAEQLGIDLPWDLDGVAAGVADDERDRDDKQIADNEFHEVAPVEGGDHVALDGEEGLARVLAADHVEGTGDHAIWQRAAHGALVGRDVADLAVDATVGGEDVIAVERLGRIEQPGDGAPLLELLGHTDMPPGGVVAVTVNDVVAAVAPVESGPFGVESLVHTLLLPDPFASGNDVQAYLVEGEPGAETLTPVALTEHES